MSSNEFHPNVTFKPCDRLPGKGEYHFHQVTQTGLRRNELPGKDFRDAKFAACEQVTGKPRKFPNERDRAKWVQVANILAKRGFQVTLIQTVGTYA